MMPVLNKLKEMTSFLIDITCFSLVYFNFHGVPAAIKVLAVIFMMCCIVFNRLILSLSVSARKAFLRYMFIGVPLVVLYSGTIESFIFLSLFAIYDVLGTVAAKYITDNHLTINRSGD